MIGIGGQKFCTKRNVIGWCDCGKASHRKKKFEPIDGGIYIAVINFHESCCVEPVIDADHIPPSYSIVFLKHEKTYFEWRKLFNVMNTDVAENEKLIPNFLLQDHDDAEGIELEVPGTIKKKNISTEM